MVCVWQANGINMHPVQLIFPVALAVNFSFILPVSTPGNAIVYAYGDITVPDMVRLCRLFSLIFMFSRDALSVSKNRTLSTFANDSNNTGSISTNFDTKQSSRSPHLIFSVIL